METVFRELKVKLRGDEVAERAERMARLRAEADRVKFQRATAAKAMKQEFDSLDAKIQELASIVRDKAELRDVECMVENNSVRCVVEVIRLDTHEVVESRAMSAAELRESRQHTLFSARPVAETETARAG